MLIVHGKKPLLIILFSVNLPIHNCTTINKEVNPFVFFLFFCHLFYKKNSIKYSSYFSNFICIPFNRRESSRGLSANRYHSKF